MATAKQRAWRKKFAAMARRGSFRKARKVRVITKVIHRKSMVKRRRSGSFRKRFTRRGARGALGSAKGIFKDVSAGVGGGMVAEQIAMRVFPQASPIAGLAGAWIAGGTKGIIGKIGFDAITGQGGILSGIFGGGMSQGGGDTL